MKPFYGLPRPETNWFWDLRRPRPRARRRVGAKTNIAGEIVPGWSRGRLQVGLSCVVHRACVVLTPCNTAITSPADAICAICEDKTSRYEDKYRGGWKSGTAIRAFPRVRREKFSSQNILRKGSLLLGCLQISPQALWKVLEILSKFLNNRNSRQLITHFKIKMGAIWMLRLNEMVAC